MCPGVLKKNISTQQSTRLEMALEDGGDIGRWHWEMALGRWLKIAAAALGSGGGRRTCNKGIGVDVGIEVVDSVGLLLHCQHQRWQGWQERMHPMQGTYIKGNGKEIGVSWQWWRLCGCKDGASKARARG